MNKERQNEPLFLCRLSVCIRQITSLSEVKAAPFPQSLTPSVPFGAISAAAPLGKRRGRKCGRTDGRGRRPPRPRPRPGRHFDDG